MTAVQWVCGCRVATELKAIFSRLRRTHARIARVRVEVYTLRDVPSPLPTMGKRSH